MLCKKCNTKNNYGKFCFNCGTTLERTERYINAFYIEYVNISKKDVLTLKENLDDETTTISLKQGGSIDVRGLYYMCRDSIGLMQIRKSPQ